MGLQRRLKEIENKIGSVETQREERLLEGSRIALLKKIGEIEVELTARKEL